MNVDFQELFEQRYANEHFVNVLPSGIYPETKIVSGTNFCEIGIQPIPNSGLLAILVVEDNLVKGAAGQAVKDNEYCVLMVRNYWPKKYISTPIGLSMGKNLVLAL